MDCHPILHELTLFFVVLFFSLNSQCVNARKSPSLLLKCKCIFHFAVDIRYCYKRRQKPAVKKLILEKRDCFLELGEGGGHNTYERYVTLLL